MSVPPVIEASALTKSFGATHAVANLDLQIAPGEIYGLVGSDGAGKTTTLRMLVGALRADLGECRICGNDVRTRPEQARAGIGYLSQRFSLYEELTVLENIRFFAEVRGLERAEWLPRSMETLEFVGLAQFRDRRAGQLSGGMRQKLGLATALVTRPRALLLDEPTTGVDPITRQDFWKLIIRLVGASADSDDGGVAVLITTPYMDEASRCNRVGFMRDGSLIAEDAPSRLRDQLRSRILELRGDDLPGLRRAATALSGIDAVRAFGDRLHLRTASPVNEAFIAGVERQLRSHGHAVSLVRETVPTLEDVFILLSERGYE